MIRNFLHSRDSEARRRLLLILLTDQIGVLSQWIPLECDVEPLRLHGTDWCPLRVQTQVNLQALAFTFNGKPSTESQNAQQDNLNFFKGKSQISDLI